MVLVVCAASHYANKTPLTVVVSAPVKLKTCLIILVAAATVVVIVSNSK